MSDRMRKNLQKYAMFAALSIAVGVLTALLAQLSGDGPINWRPVITAGVASLLAVLTMALAAMKLTRVGSEDIAAQVDMLREDGVHRADMVVLPKDEAVALAAEVPPIHPDMTPGQTDQLLTLISRVGPVRSIVVLNDAAYREPAIDPTPSQADATLDALDLPEPGHGGRG